MEEIAINGTGIFYQTGGTNSISNSLEMGYGQYGSGTYDLSGTGSLSANVEDIGYSLFGRGYFNQSNGTDTTQETSILVTARVAKALTT